MSVVAVTYRAGNAEQTVEVAQPRFLLGGENGSYLALGSPVQSNYDGWKTIGPDGARWKILADLMCTAPMTALALDGDGATRACGSAAHVITLSSRGVRVRGEGAFLVTLDCKREYDESDQGRIYMVTSAAESAAPRPSSKSVGNVTSLTVTYTKYRDSRIAPDNIAYKTYVGVASTFALARRDMWRPMRYAYDERRGTKSTPWAYDLALASGRGDLAIALGNDPRDAQHKAMDLLLRPEKRPQEQFPPRIVAAPLGSRLAWRSLVALGAPSRVLAGYPWFASRWSRDELLCCGALLAAGERESVERILDTWYRAVRPDGSLPAIHPDAGLRSADAPGWLGRRTLDLLATGHAVDPTTLARWRDAAERLVSGLTLRDGLVWTGPNETWMDTAGNDDGRAGARIEIQALALALADAHARLCERTGMPIPERTRMLLVGISSAIPLRFVRDGMLIDGLLTDGSVDVAIRPNTFLAWYAYPSLVDNELWKRTFWRSLESLWLPWGGIATLARSDPRFRGRDTGEDTAAYHRGDSWYFVNAIAAMALRSVDTEGGKVPAARLIAAIERDLSQQGYLGHISEISNADSQEAMGCHAQAWSAACYLEALLSRTP